MQPQSNMFGAQIRRWRERRRLSQMALSLDAEISTRHLSFIETGRSAASREMVLRLARQLDVPLRDRNTLLLAAGYAPAYAEHALDDAHLDGARRAIELVLAAHEPFPALAIDRHWTLVAANGAVGPLMAGVSPALLEPPVNVLRLSLHPDGLAPRILNLAEWRGHLFDRLERQASATADADIAALLAELMAYPSAEGCGTRDDLAGVAVPLTLASPVGELRFLSTTTVFGTPTDITLSELAIEAFLPADATTGDRLRALAG